MPVVITGGTGSLGYRTAELLAADHWSVVITGRNRAATAEAADTLTQRTGGEVIGVPLDLISLNDVRRFATELTTSKLCNVLMTYELDRRLATGELGPTSVTVNAFDPGLMPGTGLARDYSPIQTFAWRYLFSILTVGARSERAYPK